MKIVFMGTPDFSVSSLEKLVNSSHEVLAVITNVDKRVGRKSEICFSPVKAFAIKNNIPVFQYEKISKEGVEDLKKLNPDVCVTCAFGQILSKEILDVPKFGVINVHASLLPKYRGASPIQHAVLNGDKETGITIMQTETGLDCGDIILQKKTEIFENETSSELFDRLSSFGGECLIEALDLIESGKATFSKQNDEKATFVKQLKKTDGLIDWGFSCEKIHNFVRGMQAWPCAYTFVDGKIMKIFKVKTVEFNGENEKFECGQIVSANPKEGFKVACKDGVVEILELQLEGGKRMDGKSFLLGHSFNVGDRLNND